MALAAVVIDVVEAGAPVPTRCRGALVDVDVTVVARVAGAGALTTVAVQPVNAVPVVEARLRLYEKLHFKSWYFCE